MVTAAKDDLRREGFPPKRQRLELLLDVRYVGQSFEITVPFARRYRADFDERHGRLYGYSNPHRATEVVAVRVRAAGITDKPALPRGRAKRLTPRPEAVRKGRFNGRDVMIASFRWDKLMPGARAAGPAVITGGEATVVVPPKTTFQLDAFANVILSGSRLTAHGSRKNS